MVYKVKLWMHAVPVCHFHLPGCTEALCQTKCSEYASKVNKVAKSSKCDRPDICHCECSAKQHLPLTTEVMGLADAEDDNGTFV